MRKLKKITILTVSALFLTGTSMALACPGGPKGPIEIEKKMVFLQEKLNLTDGQVKDILSGVNTIKNNGECEGLGTSFEKFTCFKEKKNSIRNTIESVLTEDQKSKFAELREMKKKFKKRFKRNN